MKKRIIRILGLVLCASMLFGLTGADKPVFGEEEKQEADSAVGKIASALTEKNSENLLGGQIAYVITDAAGTPQKVILSDGNEMEEKDAGSFVRPVDVKVTYLLNGAVTAPEDMAGVSGDVTIRFDYTCNEKKTVRIDGKEEEFTVPFAVVSGLILDNEHFSSVEVVNGRIADDGSRTIVGGIALPGIKEDIDPKGELELVSDLPDYIEITAKADDFELEMTMSVVIPVSLEDFDTDSLDDLKKLGNGIDDLKDAMEKLKNGSKELSKGAETLDNGTGELYSGIKELSGGLGTLSGNSDSLRSGAKQVFNSLLSTVNAQLAAGGIDAPKLTVSNYADVLNGIIDTLDSEKVYAQALKTVTAAVSSREEEIRAAVKAEIKNQLIASVGESLAEAMLESDEIKGMIEENVKAQKEKLIAENMASDEVSAKLSAAAQGAKSVIAAKTQLDSYNAFYRGIKDYTAGVDAAAKGASKIKQGAKELTDGTGRISEGAKELSDGIDRFDSEGISKITEVFDEKLADAAERFAKLVEISKETEQTKYVIRSASIGK